MVRSGPPVKFENNIYWRPGGETARWSYGGREYAGVDLWRKIAPQDLFQSPGLAARWLAPSSRIDLPPLPRTGRWTLALFAGKAAADARSQLVFVQAAVAQYPALDACIAIVADAHLAYDWNLGAVRRIEARTGVNFMLALVAPEGNVVAAWSKLARPAVLGLALKRHLGAAASNALLPMEGSLP